MKLNKIKKIDIDNLPLSIKLDEISKTIANCMITVVCSNNNSGKTIGIPNRLSKNKYFKGKIYSALQTTEAPNFLYKKQNRLCNLSICDDFSYDKDKFNSSTKIVYCTYNYLLNKMISLVSGEINIKQWFCSVLILDDFQSRTIEVDLCLCLWIYYYKLWRKNPLIPKPPKLVIMTTQLDNDIIQMLPTKPSLLSYTFQQQSITTVFDTTSEKIASDCKIRLLRAIDIANQYHKNGYNGTYLIFLPSSEDVDMVANILKKKFDNNINLKLLQANGLTNYSQFYLSSKGKQAFHQHSDDNSKMNVRNSTKNLLNNPENPTHIRKIILAVPDAEYYPLMDNVTLVIDTLIQKKINSHTNSDISWITVANSDQRKSKLDPKCSGTYVVMQSQNNYLKLVEKIEPEIKTTLIDHYILRLIKYKLNPYLIFSPVISKSHISKCCNLLKKIGFFGDKLILTDMGNFCYEFPIDIRKAAIIYHLYKLGNTNIFLYMAVICTLNCYGSGFFVWPKKKPNEDALAHSMRCDDVVDQFEKKFGGYSDIDTLFRIWAQMFLTMNPFYITDLKFFCQKNQLNFKCFKDAIQLLKKCIIIVNKYFYYNTNFIKSSLIDYEELSNTFYSLLSQTHSDYETTIVHKSNGNTVAICNGIEYKIDRKAIHLMNVGNSSKKIYYSLVQTHKCTKKGTIRIINVLHAIIDESDTTKIFMSESDVEDETNTLDYTISDDSWDNFLANYKLTDCFRNT